MRSIPVCRAAHLVPYNDFLHKLGAPVEREMLHNGLPSQLPDEPDAYLPGQKLLDYLQSIEHSEGIDDLGFRVARLMSIKDLDPHLFAHIANVPTLKAALELFCHYATQEDSGMQAFLVPDKQSVRACTTVEYAVTIPEQFRLGDWTQNFAFISIIRYFAGISWQPPSMGFTSSLPVCPQTQEKFPNTRFYTAQKASWVEVPKKLLALSPTERRSGYGISSDDTKQPPYSWDVAYTLTKLLESYLVDGAPNIHLAAEISGTSVRTLQRRLKESGLSYSKALENARFNRGANLLKMPDVKIIDIAFSLGYEDPSHFSRAFRRVAGISPREYRQQQLAS